MKIRSLLFATLLAFPLTTFAEDTAKQPAETPTAPTKPVDKPGTTDKAKAAKLSKPEIAIVAHVHHVNVMEVAMGKQAQKQGTAAVKRYGEMLVRDHQTADKELIAMAKQHGLARIPADKPQNEAEKAEQKTQMDAMKKLKTLKAEDYDRAFLQLMVESHEKEVAKSDSAIAIVQTEALKTMLESRKASLQRHADAARELQKGNAQARADAPKSTR